MFTKINFKNIVGVFKTTAFSKNYFIKGNMCVKFLLSNKIVRGSKHFVKIISLK